MSMQEQMHLLQSLGMFQALYADAAQIARRGEILCCQKFCSRIAELLHVPHLTSSKVWQSRQRGPPNVLPHYVSDCGPPPPPPQTAAVQ